MRVFQQLGIVDAVLPYTEPFTPSEWFGADGQLIRRMTMVEPPYPQGYTPSLVFTQPPVERVLRERVAQLPGVDGGARHRGDGAGAGRRGRHAGAAFADDGVESAPCSARWVIACDGGASTLRGKVGIALEDLDFDEPWLVVDVRVNDRGLGQTADHQRAVLRARAARARWSSALATTGAGRSALKPGEDPQRHGHRRPKAPGRLLSALADAGRWCRCGARPATASMRWWPSAGARAGCSWPVTRRTCSRRSSARACARACATWPTCAWKLAAVLQGRGAGRRRPRRLLDSYGHERKAHVRALTTRLQGGLGAIICERDPVTRPAPATRSCWPTAAAWSRTRRARTCCPGWTTGLLAAHRHARAAARCSRSRGWRDGSAAGGVLLDQRFGAGWRVVTDAALAAGWPQPAGADGITAIALGQRGAPRPRREGVVAAWMQRHGCNAALVRPDHYVYGTAATAVELETLLTERRAALAA